MSVDQVTNGGIFKNYGSFSDEVEKSGLSGELIGGIVAGILVIVALILLFLFARHRKSDPKLAEHRSVATETMTADNGLNGSAIPPIPPALPPERENQSYGRERIIRGPKDDEMHKFAAPVWIEEIQKNKMFNRQKRLLSEDRIRNGSDEQLPLRNVPEPPAGFREESGGHSGDEGRRETTKTESDEDNFEKPPSAAAINTVGFHKHHHIQLETQI